MNPSPPCPFGPEWTPAEDALLGTAPDQRVGKMIRRNATSVGNRRKLLGIPQYVAPSKWRLEHDALLGTVPDYNVSAIVGLSLEKVKKRREELGIMAYIQRAETKLSPKRKIPAETDPRRPFVESVIGRDKRIKGSRWRDPPQNSAERGADR